MQPDQIDCDVIVIPPDIRGLLISEFKISARLSNMLVSNGLQFLGDLHGLHFRRICVLKKCGPKSIRELRHLVRRVHDGKNFLEPHISKRSEFILIPAGACEAKPSELPISARLASILQYMEVQRLGDLEGKKFSDLFKVKNCGPKTLKEFASLLKRAETGEFDSPVEAFSPPALRDVISLLDKLLMELSPRDREILLLRFDANAGSTLIASKLQLSHERIRQIVKKKLADLIKTGGPKLIAYLKGIADLCHQSVGPLTFKLFAYWVAQYSVQHQFALPFYVHLLEQLNHDIPVRATLRA
jgi:hypothetical protein